MKNHHSPHSRLLQRLETLCLDLDRRPGPPWTLFIATATLLLLLMFPGSWTGNEENYFQLAHRAYSPEKFSPFSAVFDQSKGRIVFEYLLGWLVDLLGYESTHAIARTGMALGYACSLCLLFSALRLSCLDALLSLILFRLCGEQLMGGEWLFQGVEAKTVAYALIIPALVFAVHSRLLAATLLCAAATYLHFLVGGFWTLITLATHWLIARDTVATWKAGLLYGLLAMPLAYLIALDQLSAAPLTQEAMPSVERIYGEIRDPHHLAPFKSLWTFWEWMPGVVATACLGAVFGILIYKKQAPPIALAPFLGLIYLLVALLLAYLDRNTLWLAKLYLFRPSSLTLFLSLAVGVSLLRGSPARPELARSLLVGALVTVIAFQAIQTDLLALLKGGNPSFEEELIARIEAHSAPGEIVLLEPYREMDAPYARLHRTIPRPTLVSWKFVPTNPVEILRWYRLIQQREALFQKGCSQPMEANVTLIVGFKTQSRAQLADCGPVIWQRGDVFLVKVAPLNATQPPRAGTAPPRSSQNSE